MNIIVKYFFMLIEEYILTLKIMAFILFMLYN